MFETTVFIVALNLGFCLWTTVLSRCCIYEKMHMLSGWQHCTPSLHNTARTGSTARAWGSKYPAGLNLIHWGKLAWSCHHAQRSLKCMFVKNAGFGTRELRCYLPRHCEVTLLTKGRSGWPRAPGWRDDRRCRRRVFSEHVQISTGLCVFHISRLSSSLAAF